MYIMRHFDITSVYEKDTILLELDSAFWNKIEYSKIYNFIWVPPHFSVLTFMEEMSNIFVYKFLFKRALSSSLEQN